MQQHDYNHELQLVVANCEARRRNFQEGLLRGVEHVWSTASYGPTSCADHKVAPRQHLDIQYKAVFDFAAFGSADLAWLQRMAECAGGAPRPLFMQAGHLHEERYVVCALGAILPMLRREQERRRQCRESCDMAEAWRVWPRDSRIVADHQAAAALAQTLHVELIEPFDLSRTCSYTLEGQAGAADEDEYFVQYGTLQQSDEDDGGHKRGRLLAVWAPLMSMQYWALLPQLEPRSLMTPKSLVVKSLDEFKRALIRTELLAQPS